MSLRFATAQDLLHYLDNLNFFHMDLSLGRMQTTLAAMDLLRPPYKIVQVVGTNGKGSTATFLASLAQAHGIKAGLYTSPHFVTPAERILIAGQKMPEETWLESAATALHYCQDLTYFELITVIALDLFRKHKVDVAILEAGLGARFDATSATAADLVCFVPIALDHTAILGATLEAIAAEKSSAIRTQAPVVSALQQDSVLTLLQERAQSFSAPFTLAEPVSPTTKLGLLGAHQYANAGTALQAFLALSTLLNVKPHAEKIQAGLAHAFIPGRMQYVAKDKALQLPACLLDGAHNPHGVQSLTTSLAKYAIQPKAVIYSCLADKDWRTGLSALAQALPNVPFLILAMHNERAEQANVIYDFLAEHGCKALFVQESLPQALDFAQTLSGDGPVLITGSLYLLGHFFELYPSTLGL